MNFLIFNKLVGYSWSSMNKAIDIVDEIHRFTIVDSIALMHEKDRLNNVKSIRSSVFFKCDLNMIGASVKL